jgi:hypothetical protein
VTHSTGTGGLTQTATTEASPVGYSRGVSARFAELERSPVQLQVPRSDHLTCLLKQVANRR